MAHIIELFFNEPPPSPPLRFKSHRSLIKLLFLNRKYLRALARLGYVKASKVLGRGEETVDQLFSRAAEDILTALGV